MTNEEEAEFSNQNYKEVQMPHSWDTDEDSSTTGGISFDLENIAISALRFFAWLDLIAGIVFSIIIWSKFSTSEISTGFYTSRTATLSNPVAIGIGIAVLLQGIFVWALFLVLSSIAQNLITIRNNTEPSKIAQQK